MLESGGRAGKTVTFVSLQTEHCNFTNHGDNTDIKAEQDQVRAESKLNERQVPVLQLVRSRWIDDHFETMQRNVLGAFPDLYGKKGSNARRMPFDTLQQLHNKKLLETRTIAGRNLYRPVGVDLSAAKLELSEPPKAAPPTPQTPIPTQYVEVVISPSPSVPKVESLESVESVSEVQGELLAEVPGSTNGKPDLFSCRGGAGIAVVTAGNGHAG